MTDRSRSPRPAPSAGIATTRRSAKNGAPAIPAVGPRGVMRVPAVAERVLGNGLRVVVARRPGVPRFEARLRVPTVRNGRADVHARQLVLAETLLSGTARRSSVEIVEAAQRLGGSLSVSADAEFVVVGGSALSTSLAPFVALMGEVVEEAIFPADEVALQRDRIVQEILLAQSQPESIARDALVGRFYGRHPYGQGIPRPEAVAAVRPAALRSAHQTRLLPQGSVLVLVGDVAAGRALDAIETVFSGWGAKLPRGAANRGSEGDRLPVPPPPGPQPLLIVDRPGAVQTNIRMAGPAAPRQHPDYAALVLANAVFGGYFTSRLVENIRERRGYTYSPGSAIEHRQAASMFGVSADVGTEVTAAALVEIRYELGRMVTTKVEQHELDAARRYLQGTLAMSIQTRAGLIAYLSTLAAFDLGADYLRDYPGRLDQVTVDAVREASMRYLAPTRLVTVLVGDAPAIGPEVEALDTTEIRLAPS